MSQYASRGSSSVPPARQKSIVETPTAPGRRSSLSHLPTLGDSGEIRSADRTEPKLDRFVTESFANTKLPDNVEARLDTVQSLEACSSYPMTTIRTVIGRGSDVDVRINDPRVSRKHASIFYTGSEFRIRDESSVNGTLLNGSKVVEYAIRDGDDLRIGDALLRFRLRVA